MAAKELPHAQGQGHAGVVPGELGQVLGGQHDAPLIALVGPPELWQLVHFLEEGLGQSPPHQH